MEHREKDLPRGGEPSTIYPPPPPPRSDSDKPKEKRSPMLLIVPGLLVLEAVIISLLKETAGISPAFCGSGLIALDIAIITLRKKIIMSQVKRKNNLK